jgi:glutamyl/glutaminyl-tRNA synthetase
MKSGYRGRLAPTPTGYLHLGHAATFQTVCQRARAAAGTLILRIEDLDPHRCKPGFVAAAVEDLRWLGFTWNEGPDLGGPCAPYLQSERRERYLAAFRRLFESGFIYPCTRSRKDVASVALAPHEEEPIFPVEWRPAGGWTRLAPLGTPSGLNWRFRVPDHEEIIFHDANYGEIRRVALRDFGDFLIWNRDDIPAYELAVVVDDIAMGITEVVRGADLLTSTARQLLLYRALGAAPPAFFHCDLLVDASGRRLAKRDQSLAIRTLRAQGWTADRVLAEVASAARRRV